MPFAAIKGARFYYEIAGTGYPLVLIHGGLSDSSMWDAQWLDFARAFRAIRYDLRGMGASSIPTEPYSHVQDLEFVLDYLGVEKAHLLGISLGGRIALDFALTYPEIASSVILVSSSISGAPASEDSKIRWSAIDAAWARGDKALANELELQMWVDGPRRQPGQIDSTIREQLKKSNAHNFELASKEGFAEQVEISLPAFDRLNELRVPALVLAGDKDNEDVHSRFKKMKQELPDVQARLIENSAHMVNMEQPELFNQLVQDFLVSMLVAR